MKSWVLSAAFWTLTTTSCCNVWHLESYISHTYHSCFTLINSYDSQLKTRKKIRIICKKFRKLNLDPNTKYLWNLFLHLVYLKIIVEILKKIRVRLPDSISFQKNNYLDNISCGYAIQSWLHEGLGELHVNIPTVVGPMETSRLQTSLVWNWKTKLGRQNFKLVLVDRVQNIAVMPTAKS
jgi:hypothetical protein